MTVPLLELNNVSKTFGTLPTLQNVSFNLFAGEVVGLAGRSGAGKTVLASLIAGLEPVTSGDIKFNGKLLRFPFAARKLGIEVIHQKPILADRLDITTNIFLGNERVWKGLGKWLKIPSQTQMDKEAVQILEQLGVTFDSLRQKVANLPSEQRQLIAIAQVLSATPKLIFIDEPTSLLGYSHQQTLLSLIQRWQQQKIGIVFASNNLNHLFAVADRIIVLRQGRSVASFRTDETTREEVVASLLNVTDQRQITPAIWAFDSFSRARQQTEQLKHQQQLLKKDLAAQDSLNQQLIEQLSKQVEALDNANIALQDAQRRLLTQREEERKHLARELHDQVIQDLLSTNYELEDIGAREYFPPHLQNHLASIRVGIRGLVDDVRRICGELRPPTIDSFGLGAALQSYTHAWQSRTGIETHLSIDAELGRMPEVIELSIFRIVQEALSNVRKHARASQVKIVLHHTSPRMLLVSISDNGTGITSLFDLSALSAAGHYGLLGISERVTLLGGRLKLQNQPEGGLTLEVEIPHPRVNVNLDPL